MWSHKKEFYLYIYIYTIKVVYAVHIFIVKEEWCVSMHFFVQSRGLFTLNSREYENNFCGIGDFRFRV